MTKGKILRFPRPLGVSMLMQEYQKGNPESRERAIKICIQYWMTTGGSLFGKTLSMLEICACLHIQPEVIQGYLKENMLNTKLWNKGDDTEQLIAQIIGTQVAWALEDRMDISHQVNILKNSQGEGYAPFLSGEVNKALDLKVKSTNNLNNLLRSMTSGQGSVNIFQGDQNNQQNIQVNAVTKEDAFELITKEIREISRPQEIQYLEANYDLEDLPEVKATKQTGLDTSKEGLTLKTSEILSITDNYKGALSASDKEHHEMRREFEQRINPEEIDPEVDSY